MTATNPVTNRPYATRDSDRMTMPMFTVGVLFVLLGVALAAFTAVADKIVMTLFIIGALCMPTHRFIQAINVWRKNGNGGTAE